MTAVPLFLAHALVLGIIVLGLHALTPRYGFAPLLVAMGGLTMLLQTQADVITALTPTISITLSQVAFVPVLLVGVLVVYIANGAGAARMLIVSMLGLSVLTAVLAATFRFMVGLDLPAQGANLFQLEPVAPRLILASLIAFTGDLIGISIVYQGFRNTLRRVPEALIVGVALLVALTIDAVVYAVLANGGGEMILAALVSGLAAKILGALVLWAPVGFYVGYIAPRQKNFTGGANRPLLDLFTNASRDAQLALSNAERARQTAELERQRDATYFRQVAESIDEGLWLSDVDQRQVFYVNPAYERIWGRSADDILNRNLFAETLHPEDRDRILGGLRGQLSGDYVVEYRIIRPDGDIRWIRDRAAPIPDESGQYYRIVGLAADITEAKRTETERIELALEREKVRLLRDFIAEVTHDLKTPLSAINLKIHQAAKTEDPAARARIFDEVRMQSARMGKMINDTLTLSRLDNLNEFTLTRTDLNELLHDICHQASTLARTKDISIVELLDSRLPAVLADRDDMHRALANLVENAVFYTPKGGRVEVRSAFASGAVLITISDNGIGIPENDLPHVFDRFYRGANARKTDPGGTGLGLAIVKRVIEHHHGTISVSSTMGEGTTMTVTLQPMPENRV